MKTKFTPSNEMHDAMSWCLKNGIKMYVVKKGGELSIIIEQQMGKTKSSKTYQSQSEADQKIWEIYLYFYQKLNK